MRLEDLMSKRQIDETQSTEQDIFEEDDRQFPSYLSSPEIVGYPDIDFQTEIYNWAVEDSLNYKIDVTIADVGAGRGDLFRFLKPKYLHSTIHSYTGFELTPALVQVGNSLSDDGQFNLILDDYLNYDSESFDYTYIIGSLNNVLPEYDKWDYFEKIFKKIVAYTNKEAVFILNRKSTVDFWYFPIDELFNKILNKYPSTMFQIDYTKFEDIYKLKIIF